MVVLPAEDLHHVLKALFDRVDRFSSTNNNNKLFVTTATALLTMNFPHW
jgi:hypothetical protein